MSEYHDTETGELIEARTPMVQTQMRPLASVDTIEVCTALAKAQGEFEAPKRTKEAEVSGTTRQGREYNYKYKYAPLEEIIRAVQKPMAEAGLSRQQYLVSRSGQWFVRTIVWHLSGQWISSDYPVFAEAMTGPKFAAAVTYAKRQGLSLAVCIAPEDDMDAADADPVKPPTTKGATRTAKPLPPTSAPAAQPDATSAAPSPTRSSTGNGRVPPGIATFLAKDSYEIDPDDPAVGGWAPWQRFYLRVAKHMNISQLTKLAKDNHWHFEIFTKVASEEVSKGMVEQLQEIIAAAAAKETPLMEEGDVGAALET